MQEPKKPWQIRRVTASQGYAGFHVKLYNAYTGEIAHWSLDYHSWTDRDSNRKHWTFKGAEWGPGAREAVRRVFKLAARMRKGALR